VAKSQFLTHMSHEIRTPLTALLGFADLLLQPKLTESERLNYAMIIRRNGEHLLQVINDILDLSRVEAGRLSVERISCVPAWILSEVASLMRVRAKESGLEFEARIATPIPRFLHSDPTRLRQILLNLVGNAVKFTRRGVVRLLARVDGERLVVEVVDTGIGIAPEQLQVLFQPFTQADLSLTRRFGGSGLGLAISKTLAEALGGTISVESEIGRGSTFRLSLPFEPGGETIDSLEQMPTDRPAPLASATRLAGNVLVVEDGVDNQVLITTLLRGYGVTVAVTGDGQVAVQRALDAWRNGTPFDLILMDMQMPVMDGYKATASLRRAGYPKPIVALTAHAMAGERERCLEAGCDDYVRKPIGRSELLAALEEYLPAAPQSAEDPALYSTFAGDAEMAEIIERFVAQLPQRIAALRVEARAPGSEALQRLAHQLKGAAGGYGFEPISEAAAALEQAVKAEGAQAAVQQALEALVDVCARARAGRP
jgi:CheY-like chemotaxis protein/HPt (histidine-containing phosphotransfer) domain-containing protein